MLSTHRGPSDTAAWRVIVRISLLDLIGFSSLELQQDEDHYKVTMVKYAYAKKLAKTNVIRYIHLVYAAIQTPVRF